MAEEIFREAYSEMEKKYDMFLIKALNLRIGESRLRV
jgi:hypothetical protein